MARVGQRMTATVVGCALLLQGVGCATMTSGTHQSVRVGVQPDGSEVTIYSWEGERIAGPIRSPATTEVHRPQRMRPYFAVASKPGYCPTYWVPETSMTPKW